MTFVQLEFLAFLLVVFSLYWVLPWRRAQNVLLIAASAVFYGWVHPWFLYLLGFSAVLDFLVGLGMERYPARKRWLLAVSLTGNLVMLGAFKYLDFFIENVLVAADALGVQTNLHTMGIFLPVGISFYTFQTMSYTFDVYRGKVRARRDFIDYAAFVSLFPQLVAGPVERARALLPQLEAPRRWDWDRLRSGIGLALWGATKKVLVADTISMYVDRLYNMDDPSFAIIFAATLGFSVQILADFSGYTDIARGTARMFGFELMENFRSPYLAKSPSEFWRRWHISFSSWIHEYVYIGFGGSRHGPLRRAIATYGALLLSGLWHGAAWSFVVWGAYHATILTFWRPLAKRVPERLKRLPGANAIAVGWMFCFTLFGWLLFREQDFNRTIMYLKLPMLGGTVAHHALAGACGLVALAGGGVLVLGMWGERWLIPRLRPHKTWLIAETTMWGLAVWAITLFARDTSSEFIYFQF